jgi:uncharacterized SAM-binding protein YcdF (DUF218 family)
MKTSGARQAALAGSLPNPAALAGEGRVGAQRKGGKIGAAGEGQRATNPVADAIVVLGCRPSARLMRRLECGIRLLQGDAAPLLLLSGGGDGPVPEAEIMRRMALDSGVPEAALVVEPGSRDTVENARETARLLRSRGGRSVVLVSDRVHLPRAALLFRLAGLRVAGRAGVPPPSIRWEIRTAMRECMKLPGSLGWAFLGTGRRRSSRQRSAQPRAESEAGQAVPRQQGEAQRKAAAQQTQSGDAHAGSEQSHC